MAEVLALADDTTGALEVGAQFAGHRVRSLVTSDLTHERNLKIEADAIVVDTQTRHLVPDEAAQHVRNSASAAGRLGIRHLYKKTDSTLRGNIASEFQALLEVFPERPLVYVPAYPQLGRVIVDGRLYVNDVPLEQSSFSRDPQNPVQESFIPSLLARNCRATVLQARGKDQLVELLRRVHQVHQGRDGSVIVCDGATEDDLREITSVLAGMKEPYLAAGPGGFAGHWISQLPVSRTFTEPRIHIRNCLVISGSRHPVSAEQVQKAETEGLATFRLRPPLGTDAEVAARLTTAVAERGWACLAIGGEALGSPQEPARRLGAVARQVMDARPLDGLVIFGGDTAFALMQAVGATTVESCGDLLAGIPLSMTRYGNRALGLVTKAGGFGSADVICSIRQCLEMSR